MKLINIFQNRFKFDVLQGAYSFRLVVRYKY